MSFGSASSCATCSGTGRSSTRCGPGGSGTTGPPGRRSSPPPSVARVRTPGSWSRGRPSVSESTPGRGTLPNSTRGGDGGQAGGPGGAREGADGVRLRAGTRLGVRPIRPGDADALVALHARLSADTIYRRYFGARPHLSTADVDRFTRVDGHVRFALVAMDRSD